jgi:hypothetical protein
METLSPDLMLAIATFFDTPTLLRMRACNTNWKTLLSKDEEVTWTMLIATHLGTIPLDGYTAAKSYELLILSRNNHCYFCQYNYISEVPHPDEETLCQECFDQAWVAAKDYYHTDDVIEMWGKSYKAVGADIMTFQYASPQHQEKHDMTGAQFIAGDYQFMCIDLLKHPCIGISGYSPFWTQAGLDEGL